MRSTAHTRNYYVYLGRKKIQPKKKSATTTTVQIGGSEGWLEGGIVRREIDHAAAAQPTDEDEKSWGRWRERGGKEGRKEG